LYKIHAYRGNKISELCARCAIVEFMYSHVTKVFVMFVYPPKFPPARVLALLEANGRTLNTENDRSVLVAIGLIRRNANCT